MAAAFRSFALTTAVAAFVLAVTLASFQPAAASHADPNNPETVVTGHTVLGSNLFVRGGAGGTPWARDSDGSRTESPSAGGFVARRECVVWFNGKVTFDGTPTPANLGSDFGQVNDNALDPCGQTGGLLGAQRPTDFAGLAGFAGVTVRAMIVLVETGDCDPRSAVAAGFVRDLSFADANGIHHAVAELLYTCFHDGLLDDLESELGGLPGDIPDNPRESGRREGEEPRLSDGQDPTFQSLINETFVEYAWVTWTHMPVADPTLDDGTCTPDNACVYNWAAIVDTCNDDPARSDNARSTSASSSRCTDGGGKEHLGDDEDDDGDPHDAGERVGPRFDDTTRHVVLHDAGPATCDDVRDGNSNGRSADGLCGYASSNPDAHREDKTADSNIGPGVETETDYDPAEDHLAAEVDVYVSMETCEDAQTVVGFAACQADLTPLLVNHPDCGADGDALFGDGCWLPFVAADDAGGAGEYDRIVQTLPYP